MRIVVLASLGGKQRFGPFKQQHYSARILPSGLSSWDAGSPMSQLVPPRAYSGVVLYLSLFVFKLLLMFFMIYIYILSIQYYIKHTFFIFRNYYIIVLIFISMGTKINQRSLEKGEVTEIGLWWAEKSRMCMMRH